METAGEYVYRCNARIKTIMREASIDQVHVMALRKVHRYSGHLARKIGRPEHSILAEALRHRHLAWQRTVKYLNNGRIGHPSRFYAGTQWERPLDSFYWSRMEREWLDAAQDRLKWRRTEDAWVTWRQLPQWTRK